MDFLDPVCSLNLRSIETAVVMADLEGALENYLSLGWVSAGVLVPGYLRSSPECPGKGRYFLIDDGSGGFVPVCTYHHPDKAVIYALVMEAYINRLLMYENTEFVMGAQGKRTGIDDLLHIIYNDGFEKGWRTWAGGKAIDCSGLAIEAMRDALEGIYRNNSLIPDTNALSLGKYEGKYPYTEKVKTSVNPSEMADPCLELKPGDLCIIKNLPHTTIFLGRYRKKTGDNTPYWIWASGSRKKVVVFTHDQFRKAYTGFKDQAVSRWTLKKYVP